MLFPLYKKNQNIYFLIYISCDLRLDYICLNYITKGNDHISEKSVDVTLIKS